MLCDTRQEMTCLIEKKRDTLLNLLTVAKFTAILICFWRLERNVGWLGAIEGKQRIQKYLFCVSCL